MAYLIKLYMILIFFFLLIFIIGSFHNTIQSTQSHDLWTEDAIIVQGSLYHRVCRNEYQNAILIGIGIFADPLQEELTF